MLFTAQYVPRGPKTWTKNRGIGVKGSKENDCANHKWNKRKEAGHVWRFYFKDGGETIEPKTEEEQQILPYIHSQC